MAVLFTTSAPRSTVVHVEGEDVGRTVCGRTITDDWAGMMSELSEGPVSCIKCARFAADWEESRRNECGPAKFHAGQRVGILTGLQAVNGPFIGAYGTVVSTHVFWNGVMEYSVRADGEATAYTYRDYLLTDDVSGDPARARSMAAHPAGKGKGYPRTGSRVEIVAPNFADTGRTGIVKSTNSSENTVNVKLDGDILAWAWHVTALSVIRDVRALPVPPVPAR
jgi:hypothetical protein